MEDESHISIQHNTFIREDLVKGEGFIREESSRRFLMPGAFSKSVVFLVVPRILRKFVFALSDDILSERLTQYPQVDSISA